jgi:hypothetical protein
LGINQPSSLFIFPVAGITLFSLKIRNTIHIVHCLAIAIFISILCINKNEDYSGDFTYPFKVEKFGGINLQGRFSGRSKFGKLKFGTFLSHFDALNNVFRGFGV